MKATRARMFERLFGLTVGAGAAIATAAGATPLAAQQAPRSHAVGPMGTYASNTQSLPSSGADGCWLEAAPISPDSLRVQILCRYPAPGHHIGILDARLRMSGDTVVYRRHERTQNCRIRIRFAGARALVEQRGSDIACGFGASVNVSGTYVRLNERRPPFDLAPIERPSTSHR